MDHDLIDIDHLMCGVDDPQQAGAAFERLGFTVTPLSVIAPMGLGNRCVLFRDAAPGGANYLELMGILDAAKVPPVMQQTLAGSQGIKSSVLSCRDADACHAALQSGGYAPPTPPIHMSRQWQLGDRVVEPAFAVLLPMAAPLTFNVAQHKTPQLYLDPDWTRHANTAAGVRYVMAAAEKPHAAADFFARLFGSQPRTMAPDRLEVPGVRTHLRVATAAAWTSALGRRVPASEQPRYLGFGIAVDDLQACAGSLRQSGVGFTAAGPRLLVEPQDACGNLVVFEGG